MVVNRGLEIVNDRILGAGTEPKWIHWGVGTTAPAQTNTTLETLTGVGEARTVGTGSKVTTTTTNDTYQVTGTIVATSAKTITECGLFDALTSGNMFCRATFTGIGVSINDSIAFTIKAVLAKV
jgi:hypothetical protein